MIRLLLDQGLPRSATGHLVSHGFDAVHLGDIGASTLSDAAILELARSEGRAVVTLDADFHALLAASGAKSPTVDPHSYRGAARQRNGRTAARCLGQVRVGTG